MSAFIQANALPLVFLVLAVELAGFAVLGFLPGIGGRR